MKLLLTTLTAIAISLVAAQAGEIGEISKDDLKSAIETKKVVVIDVNGTDSFKTGHIPTAIDFEANEAKLASLLPADKDALIVAYCGSENCGAYKQAANAAVKLGYTNVKHFSPGLQGWKKSGEALESES